MIKELSNQELIRLCGKESENKEAWREFMLRFDDFIGKVVWSELNKNGVLDSKKPFCESVDDLVQEVYHHLVTDKCMALKNFKGGFEGSGYTYLGVIAKNVVRNYLKKFKTAKRPKISHPLQRSTRIFINQDEPDAQKPVEYACTESEEAIKYEELKEEIENFLKHSLKGQNKERDLLIFKLRYYENLSAQEIADYFDLHLTAQGVDTVLSRIRKKLRKKFFPKT